MSFPKHFTGHLPELLILQFIELVEIYRKKLKPATIYYPKDGEDKVVPSKRISEKASFYNQTIHEKTVEYIIPQLNSLQSEIEFIAPNEHQDWVVYNPGGKFDEHRDFSKYHTEGMRTYTIIIGLYDCELGGETYIQVRHQQKTKSGKKKFIQPSTKQKFLQTTQKGGFVVFRSDLLHSGSKVIKGRKEILVITLWGFITKQKLKQVTENTLVIRTSDQKTYFVLESMMRNTLFDITKQFDMKACADTIQKIITKTDLESRQFEMIIEFLKKKKQVTQPITSELHELFEYAALFETKYQQMKLPQKDIHWLNKLFSCSSKLYLQSEYTDTLHKICDNLDVIPIQVIIHFSSYSDQYFEHSGYTKNNLTYYYRNGNNLDEILYNLKSQKVYPANIEYISIYVFNCILWKIIEKDRIINYELEEDDFKRKDCIPNNIECIIKQSIINHLDNITHYVTMHSDLSCNTVPNITLQDQDELLYQIPEDLSNVIKLINENSSNFMEEFQLQSFINTQFQKAYIETHYEYDEGCNGYDEIGPSETLSYDEYSMHGASSFFGFYRL